jgi:hypothetical protein
MHHVLASAVVLFCAALPATTQTSDPLPKKLTVQPAPEPKPALKYVLLPEVKDLQPGNAALTYLRAIKPQERQAIEHWLDVPLAKMPREEVWIPTQILNEVDNAARREFCDWDLLARLRKAGVGTLLPEVQPMRSLCNFVALRARLEMLDGKYDQAVYSLQTCLAMSRHVGEAPTPINTLVGAALAHLALDRVEEFIQQPGAPNLYWALMNLPRPLIDLRKGMEGEKITLDFHFPELKKIEKETLNPQEIERLANLCCGWPQSSRPATFEKKLELVGKLVQSYPAARQALRDAGRKANIVDELPMLQVVLIHHYKLFLQASEDILKWSNVPFWQAQNGLKKAWVDCKTLPETWPFHELLCPPIEKMRLATVRQDRKIAALCCIEAVRMNVAAKGKLPASLDDIADLPIPLDPVTGRSFEYRAKGDTFTLFGPSALGIKQDENTINYQITIAR